MAGWLSIDPIEKLKTTVIYLFFIFILVSTLTSLTTHKFDLAVTDIKPRDFSCKVPGDCKSPWICSLITQCLSSCGLAWSIHFIVSKTQCGHQGDLCFSSLTCCFTPWITHCAGLSGLTDPYQTDLSSAIVSIFPSSIRKQRNWLE